MTHSFHQINARNRNGYTLGSCVGKVKPQYIGRTHLQTTIQYICPSQNSPDNTSCQDITWIFINIICCSFHIMENFYGRVVVGDILCIKKNLGSCK